jgi:histidyl-tRNA synthetase
MPPKYKAPRGTQDVLPEVSWRWQRVEAAFRDICRRYGYREIRTPIFEDTDLFVRGVGDGTELVSKQMYTFPDRSGRSLTLRAEGTAPVVRSVLEHNLAAQGQLQKLYYIAPIFRYERPQAGRYRQHTQLGVEAIGAPGPDIDAEIIALFQDFLDAIGLEGAVAHLSSIGCPECRPTFQQALRKFFEPVIAEMCDFCQARYETNPLRILDCKAPRDVELREGAPSALDHLCDDCRQHFAGVRAHLDTLQVPYEVDPTIVRGLDYYTRTAFEVVHPSLGAKDVIMGGGRYDGLAEMLGGPPTPGIGFGSGLERLLLVLEQAGGTGSQPVRDPLDVYVAAASLEARQPAFLLAGELRRAGVSAEVDYTKRSLKAQMKEAARLGARLVALLGEDELKAEAVTVRDMESGEQLSIPRTEAVQYLAARSAANAEAQE